MCKRNKNLNFDIQITWIYCSNLEISHHFYGGTLGLPLLRDEGSAQIYRTTAGAAIGVCCAFKDRVVEPRGGMISLVTDDVNGWYKQLSESGVTTRGLPHVLEEFGIYTFFAEDPDGYVIEFQQFL